MREYTPTELSNVIEAAEFTITTLFTEHNNTNEQTTWVYDLLRQHGFNTDLRGEQIYVVATKTGDSPENSRYPSFLYVR